MLWPPLQLGAVGLGSRLMSASRPCSSEAGSRRGSSESTKARDDAPLSIDAASLLKTVKSTNNTG